MDMFSYRVVETKHTATENTDLVLKEWSEYREASGPDLLKRAVVGMNWMRSSDQFEYHCGVDHSYRLEQWSYVDNKWELIGMLDKREFIENEDSQYDDSDPTESLELGLKPERYGD